jgi:uncharacterized protein YbaP (TraB family)
MGKKDIDTLVNALGSRIDELVVKSHSGTKRELSTILAEQNSKHAALLNRFEDHVKDEAAERAQRNAEIAGIQISQQKTQTNQDWLMRFFWAFMTPVVGALVAIVLKLY